MVIRCAHANRYVSITIKYTLEINIYEVVLMILLIFYFLSTLQGDKTKLVNIDESLIGNLQLRDNR